MEFGSILTVELFLAKLSKALLPSTSLPPTSLLSFSLANLEAVEPETTSNAETVDIPARFVFRLLVTILSAQTIQ